MYYYSIFKANKNHQWLIKCDDNYLLEVSYIKDIKTFSQELLTDISHQNALSVKVKEELEEYIHLKRKEFDIPLKLNGSEFQQKVLRATMNVPFSKTKSYLDIAKAIDSPKASRAVGMALNKNPISIIIPCHRIIGSNNKLTGYASGLEVKRFLLDLEKTKN